MLLYSFHDEGAGRMQSWVVSLRLLQPALPIWIVGYAAAASGLVAPYLRRGLRATAAVAILGCALLVIGQVVMFSAHQRHLETLRQAREAVVSRVPGGARVVGNSTLRKLFAILDSDLPPYRWIAYDREGEVIGPAALDRALAASPDGAERWYLAVLPKRPGYEFPFELRETIRRYHMIPIQTPAPDLILYRSGPPDPAHQPSRTAR